KPTPAPNPPQPQPRRQPPPHPPRHPPPQRRHCTLIVSSAAAALIAAPLPMTGAAMDWDVAPRHSTPAMPRTTRRLVFSMSDTPLFTLIIIKRRFWGCCDLPRGSGGFLHSAHPPHRLSKAGERAGTVDRRFLNGTRKFSGLLGHHLHLSAGMLGANFHQFR